MPTWPAALPQRPLRDGFQKSGPDNTVIGFGTESGPGKTRRRSTARTKPMQLTFRLDVDLVDDFEAFYEDELLDGALSFTMPDPITEVSITVQFDPETRPHYTITNVGGRVFDLSLRSLRRMPA
jgi:hypothetical protein